MAKTNNLSDFLTDIANSIRTKKGTTGTINAQNFSSEIASIETDNPYIATTTTEMTQYLTSKYDGAIVRYTGTTGTYTQNMLYKVKTVSANEWAFDELLTPVGSTTKTANGTYNVKEYAEVVVNVSIGITPTGNINITDTNTTDVTNYATAKVVDSNLVASNIKKDTTILGVTGTYEGSVNNPYTAANATEMAQYLASKYYDSVVKYTGTTGTYTNGRLYKVIQVTSNEYAFEELITPVGSITKTTNGTYDVKEYAEVVVNVPSSGSTLKNLLDTTKSAYCLFYDYKGTSVDDLIQYSDTENVTDMGYMFYYAYNLTTVPQLDTSKVTKMSNIFYNCRALTTVPLLNTSNVKTMEAMFNSCRALTAIPLLDTSNVTNMYEMFLSCSSLTTIPALNADKVTNMSSMFYGCSNLKSILMTNIGADLDIHYSTKFERSDLLVILNNLKTVTSSKTLTMGADNLAKLTEEDKAIATNKG